MELVGQPNRADDVLHFFEGWIIFLACAGLLMLVIYLLSRIGSKGESFYDAFYFTQNSG